MKDELHIVPDLCDEEAIYHVLIGDEYITTYTSWEDLCENINEDIETKLKEE